MIKAYFDRIQGRLLAALGALVAGTLLVWWLGATTLADFSEDVSSQFERVQRSSDVGTRLVLTIMDQIAAGEQYLLRGEDVAVQNFRRTGNQAHDLSRRYADLPGLSPAEQQQLAQIEALHSRVEVAYALAHAEFDLGDPAAAIARVQRADQNVEELEQLVQALTAGVAARMSEIVGSVQTAALERQPIMLAAVLLTTGLGVLLVFGTLRAINQPLGRLVGAANRLGQGDLTGAIDGRMPGELRELSAAFGAMADRLRGIVSETVGTSDQIAASASELTAISEQVAASSGEVSSAMTGITTGAIEQSSGIQDADRGLGEIRASSTQVSATSDELRRYSDQIQQLATSKRAELGGALTLLVEVRDVVQESGEHVHTLQVSSETIETFVETIQGIARQTNLLALNAAIEAARAGEQGRGFSVVAEEVRKLADGSARAAAEVASAVQEIRERIDRVAGTMREGTRKVAGVEEVSRGVDVAFEEILGAVQHVREGAQRVADAAVANERVVMGVEASVRRVGETAESHAASAEQVSAAAQEQSAATEELSAASSELLNAAERLKELVSGFKV
ncbi:MAG: methyl-accepting chemotaxis protein [Longimicrobiales bacterium]